MRVLHFKSISMMKTFFKSTMTFTHGAVVVLFAGMLAGSPAIADKPSWAGGDKGEKGNHQGGKGNQGNQGNQGNKGNAGNKGERRDAPEGRKNAHFEDRHRTYANDYYREQFRAGRCPPGLAKKNNGCMPPGQAKKWAVGRPLPRDVMYYEVPPVLVVQFGQPPSGHRYVRVAGDILLIAIGTGLVIEAMQDLGRM